MEETKLKINEVKISVGKNEKKFYYQKLHYEDSWTKIPKLNYEYCLKNNLSIATEIDKNSDGDIILLKYLNENSQQRREREKIEIKPEKVVIDKGKYISLIKKTLGKNGKFYFYESSGFEKELYDIKWSRIEEDFFYFLLKSYKNDALKISRNEIKEIIYMEYINPRRSTLENQEIKSFTKNKGCLSSLCIIIFILTLISIV
jgi:hypothetical protein|tara:strand:- start:4732 stop:5337 length:606 start_codon:yes stop_codon:yes gene_type:complete